MDPQAAPSLPQRTATTSLLFLAKAFSTWARALSVDQFLLNWSDTRKGRQTEKSTAPDDHRANCRQIRWTPCSQQHRS